MALQSGSESRPYDRPVEPTPLEQTPWRMYGLLAALPGLLSMYLGFFHVMDALAGKVPDVSGPGIIFGLGAALAGTALSWVVFAESGKSQGRWGFALGAVASVAWLMVLTKKFGWW